MYTIYCRKSAGSMAVEALLAACGADYRAVDLERKPDGSFEDFFLRINPKAEVPTLVLPDDSVMTESGAMMIHVAELHPEAGLARPPDRRSARSSCAGPSIWRRRSTRAI